MSLHVLKSVFKTLWTAILRSFPPPSSIRPELTGIALALVDCPGEEDLTILTESLGSIGLLKSMQRSDLPLPLFRCTVSRLLRDGLARASFRFMQTEASR